MIGEDVVGEETAWAAGLQFEGNNWAMYFSYPLAFCGPTASFTGPAAGDNCPVVTFDGTATTAGSSPSLSYIWDFGDGTIDDASGATATHTFTQEGTYLVTLTVTDANGLSDSDTMLVAIVGCGPPPPAPGYDGPGVGGGPDPGAEAPDYVESGGDDSDSGGSSSGDAGTGNTDM